MKVAQPQDTDGMLSKDLLKRQLSSEEDLDLDLAVSFCTGDDPGRSFYNGEDPDIDTSFYNNNRDGGVDDPNESFYERDDADYHHQSDDEPPRKKSEDIILTRARSGFACRANLVKVTTKMFRSEVPPS